MPRILYGILAVLAAGIVFGISSAPAAELIPLVKPEVGWNPEVLVSSIGSPTEEARSTSGVSITLGWWFTGYRKTLSEVRGPVCNFSPSCSRFSQEAISKYGFAKGLLMTGDRLLRCHCCITPGDYARGTVSDKGRTVYFDPVGDHSSWGRWEP